MYAEKVALLAPFRPKPPKPPVGRSDAHALAAAAIAGVVENDVCGKDVGGVVPPPGNVCGPVPVPRSKPPANDGSVTPCCERQFRYAVNPAAPPEPLVDDVVVDVVEAADDPHAASASAPTASAVTAATHRVARAPRDVGSEARQIPPERSPCVEFVSISMARVKHLRLGDLSAIPVSSIRISPVVHRSADPASSGFHPGTTPRRQRQANFEGAAFCGGRPDRGGTPVCFGDGRHDRQSEPRALPPMRPSRIRPVEAFEDP